LFDDSVVFLHAAKYIGLRNRYGNNSLTEVVGTITNVAYILFGLSAFYASRRSDRNPRCSSSADRSHAVCRADPLTKMQCTFLTCLGVGSGLYHATGFFGFGQLDGMPMLLMICFLFLSVLGE
jgi:hypothetical protein